MKKYFTLLLLCALIPIGMKAEDVVTEPASYIFEENGTTLTIKGTGDLTAFTEDGETFAAILKEKITGGSFSVVKFVNLNKEDGKSLLINDDIIYSIIFPTGNGWEANSSIVTLDLGEATVEELTDATFHKGYYSGKMAKLILPLTIKTEDEGKMVVPSHLLRYYDKETNLQSVTIPEGYEWVGEKAFYNNENITEIKFPLSLTVIGESAFEGCEVLATVNLNVGLENIGKKAFVGTSLTQVEFPSTLRIINDGAFWNVKVTNLKFNAGLYFIGAGAFGLSGLDEEMKEKALEIPASVRYIGPGAFYTRQYQDVYFYGNRAPLMPMGTLEMGGVIVENITAFSEISHNGNNGFNPTDGGLTVENMADKVSEGYANRENYVNQRVYFCILHYPKDLGKEAREEYTDITRVYETKSDNFNKDEKYSVGKESESLTFGKCTAFTEVNYGYADTYLGSQYVWPSQSQWGRSYAVNSNGLKWDGITPYYSNLTDEDKKTLEYAGFVIGSGEGQYSEDDLRKIAHMGTRQFVLTSADVNGRNRTDIGGDEENPTPDLTMEGGKWWTICVPFDMTKEQVDDVFGAGTHVCRFSSVSRKADGVNNSIVLRFQNDVYATKWVRDEKTLLYTKQEGETPAAGDVVIYSHEAYMIRPSKSDDDATMMINFEDYENVPGSPYPTIIKANADDKSENADHTEYRFVGNYMTEVNSVVNGESKATPINVPQYSYIYAKKKTDTAYKFWFITDAGMAWSSNKCIVQATARDRGLSEYQNFFAGNAQSSKVSQMSLFGDDDNTTGIESVTIIAGEGKDAQVVYSLDGRLVSNDGSLDGLGRGVYIRDGKKFVVK